MVSVLELKRCAREMLRPCRLLPYPSVITELGLGDPRRGASRSHVAQLLAQILPGMPSDAALDQVVQRAVDFGMGQALVDCAMLDDSRLVCILEEEFGLSRFPPGRLPVKGVAALHESRVAALICRARRMRLLELSFLTWAERSSVYKPVIVDGIKRRRRNACARSLSAIWACVGATSGCSRGVPHVS